MSSTPDKKYRDQLVTLIKDVGQELIDRAEEMVSEDASFIKDFHISIDIPNPHESDPTITWSHSTLCTRAINRMTDAKFRPTVMDKNKKTGYWLVNYDPRWGRTECKCSECGDVRLYPGPISFARDYPETCPNCQAEMKADN